MFSDFRTVATERAPWFLPPPVIRKAFQVAEQRGGFLVDAVSPMDAARAIRAPVLLIHGADDRETPPAHSQRVYEALAGPRRLILVPGVGHNQSLNAPGIWVEIDKWIEESLEIVDRRLARGRRGQDARLRFAGIRRAGHGRRAELNRIEVLRRSAPIVAFTSNREPANLGPRSQVTRASSRRLPRARR